jgi:hypothetical protein
MSEKTPSVTITAEDIDAVEGIKNPEPKIDPTISQQFDRELELEQKYGDSSLRTFAESAASAASFGLTDQALIATGATTQEALRERRARNDNAALAGEIAGVAGPALLSGGSSIIAKSTAAGVKGAAKAALATEQLTAKALKKLIGETGKGELAKEVLRKSIAKGVGSAVEGSLYGTGKLISEDALGNAKFNAENLVAHAGAGAVLGGLAGGAFGAIEAVVPVFKSGKIVNFKNKTFNKPINPVNDSIELAGFTPSKASKLKSRAPHIVERFPQVIKEAAEDSNYHAFKSNKALVESMDNYLSKTGNAIDDSLKSINKDLQSTVIMPTKSKLASRVQRNLQAYKTELNLIDDAGNALPGVSSQLKKVDDIIGEFDEWLSSSNKITIPEINKLKQNYQRLANYDKNGLLPLDEKVKRNIASSIREELLDVAEAAGGELGTKLKKELADYQAARVFTDQLRNKVDKTKGWSFTDKIDMINAGMLGNLNLGAGAAYIGGKKFLESDLKRKITILSSIEKANQIVNKKISSGITKYFKGVKVPSPVGLASRTMLSSGLSQDLSGETPKKPSNKKEAFANLQTNLINMNDPEKAPSFMQRGNIEDAAPETHQYSQSILASAAYFLAQKLPTDHASRAVTDSLTKRKYEPSSIEISKFEKYLQTIENPLSVIDELNAGTITREHTEALQAVYPDIYDRIRIETMEKIETSKDPIPYQKRLNLGILLNIPTDAALVPSNIQGLQAQFKQEEQSQAGGSIAPAAGGTPVPMTRAAKLDMAESTATETQKISNRTDLN